MKGNRKIERGRQRMKEEEEEDWRRRGEGGR